MFCSMVEVVISPWFLQGSDNIISNSITLKNGKSHYKVYNDFVHHYFLIFAQQKVPSRPNYWISYQVFSCLSQNSLQRERERELCVFAL